MSLQITHPAQERLAIPLGSTYPALFEQWCGFFYVPQEPDKCKCSSLSETRKSNLFCRCHYKGSTFPQLFKDPECLSGRSLNPRPPAQQTGALPTKLTRCGCFCRFFSLTEDKAVAWILLLDPPPPLFLFPVVVLCLCTISYFFSSSVPCSSSFMWSVAITWKVPGCWSEWRIISANSLHVSDSLSSCLMSDHLMKRTPPMSDHLSKTPNFCWLEAL